MKRLLLGTALGLFSASSSLAAIVYEPFDYSDPGSVLPNGPAGNVTDHTGFFVLGGAATPAFPGRSPDGGTHTWASVATTTIRHDQGSLNASSLNTPFPIPAATGKSYVYGGTGEGNRINTGSVTTGVVYYSLMLQVQTLGSVTNNQLLAFNNVTGTQGANVTQLLGLVVAKPGVAPGTYKLGIGKNATAATYVYDESQEFTLGLAGAPVYIVGSYDFGTSGTTDAVSRLWINPDPNTFDAASPPTATATSAPVGITDISAITSFIFYQYGGTSPAGGESRVDELRIDTSWAGVTVPEPASIALLSVPTALLLRRRRGR